MFDHLSQPGLQFFRFVETGRPPQRADRSAGGTLPTRAFRYCEAATTAAALGWYVFSPTAFRLYWTGTDTFWTYPGATCWHPLGAAQFPNFRVRFDSFAPDAIKGYSPTFLGALPEPGIIQVWSGLVAQTNPNWSLVIRGPANLARGSGYELFEGLIESDRWFGPLFVNIRMTRTHSYIDFDPNTPLFQVHPIHRDAYSDTALNDVTLRAFDTLEESEWDAYYRTVVEPSKVRCPHGTHAAAVRKRRHLESRSRDKARTCITLGALRKIASPTRGWSDSMITRVAEGMGDGSVGVF